jgi:hypothetical protein
MEDTDLTKLRRARTRAYMRMRRLEELLEAARVRVARAEAAVHAAAPDLHLAPSRQRGPRRFRKSEIVRVALSALRETQHPIGVREIALRVLASKGIPADRDAIEATLYGVRKTVGSLTRRGITCKVGQGKATRHVLRSGD